MNNATAEIARQTLTKSWAWYMVRGAGLMSVVLLVTLMISGIGMVTGYTYRWLAPLKAWSLHRAIGIALSLTMICHVVFLLFDTVVNFSLPQVLVPWLSPYQSTSLLGVGVGSLWMAFGILSFYAISLIVISSLWQIDHKKLWKWLHYLSYAVAFMILLHMYFLGSDFAEGPARWLVAATGLVLVGAVIARLLRSGVMKTPEEPS